MTFNRMTKCLLSFPLYNITNITTFFQHFFVLSFNVRTMASEEIN